MHKKVIEAMREKGWSYQVIALRTNISENRLRDGNLGVREQRALERVAECEAHINIDDLGDEE